MISVLFGFPLIIILAMIQTTVVSRLPLVHGSADIVMLAVISWALRDDAKGLAAWTLFAGAIMTFISALPLYAYLPGYIVVIVIVRKLQQRIWQTPVLALFMSTFIGTLAMHAISFVVLWFNGDSIPIVDSLNIVTLPSLVLNIIAALPIYTIVNDLGNLLFPKKAEA